MTKRLADAVQRTATRTVTQGSAAWMLATVTASYTDGTVDITTATGPVSRVRRLRSYGSPQVGDRVKVARNPSGNWIVEDATAKAADGWQPIALRSGFTASTTAGDAPPACRRTADGLIQLSGMINPTGLTTTDSFVMGDMPAGIRPQYRGACVGVGDGVAVRLYINTDGTVSARLITGSSPTWVSLDGAQCR
ncbi:MULTISPECIES: hypothetical protein [unclassified Streptomyces]|uniref:hypothetical protein n=1 Tax=unclassified Streptomyces TaxID=2593676 RepID=UPI0036E88C6D